MYNVPSRIAIAFFASFGRVRFASPSRVGVLTRLFHDRGPISLVYLRYLPTQSSEIEYNYVVPLFLLSIEFQLWFKTRRFFGFVLSDIVSFFYFFIFDFLGLSIFSRVSMFRLVIAAEEINDSNKMND